MVFANLCGRGSHKGGVESNSPVGKPHSLIPRNCFAGAGRGSLEIGCHSPELRSCAWSFDHPARRNIGLTHTGLIHLKRLRGDAGYS